MGYTKKIFLKVLKTVKIFPIYFRKVIRRLQNGISNLSFPRQVLPCEDHLVGQTGIDSGDPGEDNRTGFAGQHLQVSQPDRNCLLRTQISRLCKSNGKEENFLDLTFY